MEARKTGYYWVKEAGDTDWSVAYFTEQEYMQPWIVLGTGRGYCEHDFAEINETRIKNPDEEKHR